MRVSEICRESGGDMRLAAVLVLVFVLPGVEGEGFAQDNGASKAAATQPAPHPDAGTGKVEIANVNADLLAARAATKEHRYADAEALMERDTQADPSLVLTWIELGLAQMGLEKYDKAEYSFKMALGLVACRSEFVSGGHSGGKKHTRIPFEGPGASRSLHY
jgi:cytochrome c-type biogenesis protein CcmH/NrfG